MNNELTVKYEIDGNEIKLTQKSVQDYLVNGNAKISLPEFKMFTELCKVQKLNPFLKEAYIIKYSDKTPAQLVVGKDAILKRAILNPDYDGLESGIIVVNENGIDERQGTFKLKTEELVGAWARVYRKGITYPTYVSVSFDEVAQYKGDGKLNTMWGTKGAMMCEKVAKVRALRETFVEDLQGMYEEEEYTHQDLPDVQHGSDKEIINQEEVEEATYTTSEEIIVDEIDINSL